MRSDLILEDTTLRDGEQSPGVAFSKETKLAIFDALVAAGVKWIEAGIAVMGGEELATLEALLERKNEATLVGWNRGVKADVKQTIDLGFEAIHIGLPASKLHLKDSVRGKSRGWLIESAMDLIKYAKDRGVFVSVSAEDAGRTELAFLQEYAGKVHEAGADRLRLSDTIGIMTPEQYGEKIGAVAAACDIDLMCHTHNDFGLAVANTIAGLKAGARYFHCTVNAIGERAGMSDIAQVVFALKYLYGYDLGVDGRELKRSSALVARACGHPPPPWHPIVGENVFSHESGIHVNGMLKNKKTFEPFPAEAAAGERRFVIGKHSGRATLAYYLEQRGVQASDEVLQICLDRVRQLSIDKASAVTTDELHCIYREVAAR